MHERSKRYTFQYFSILAQFTQMVWAKSVKFGCGKARSRTGKIIVVANYEPKVNTFGYKLKHSVLQGYFWISLYTVIKYIFA